MSKKLFHFSNIPSLFSHLCHWKSNIQSTPRLFGTKCDKCYRSFGKNDFVMRAKNKIFHLECFRCVACEKHLVPGDEFALRDDGLFCREDHQESDHHHRKESIENNNTILHHNASNSSEDNSEGKSTPKSLCGHVEALVIIWPRTTLITVNFSSLRFFRWRHECHWWWIVLHLEWRRW